MTSKHQLLNFLQPLVFGSFINVVGLMIQNRVDEAFIPRAILVSLISFLTAPLRLLERLHYGWQVKRSRISDPPIFIIGHWRSGTTHLHNLLCQDENLIGVSTLQTIAPEMYFIGDKTIKSIAERILPPTRLMDNMAWSMDSPQEEEFAIANMSPYSFYHHWTFPRKARYYFEKYALFNEVPKKVIAKWKEIYVSILTKAGLHKGGKRLVIKNPTNTGRIKVLLELFPRAKFIHIYRDPYRVYLSTKHLYRRTLPITQLQEISDAETEDNILLFYKELMQRYLADKELIPPENLVEVKFETLEEKPLEELERIYKHLALPGFKEAKPVFQSYLDARADYQKNQYDGLDKDLIAKVNQHWGFAIETWGYQKLAT
jgi:hypothetical protein